MHRKSKLIVAGLMALTMVAPTVASIAPMTVSAGQGLGESDFTHKALPWHTCESSPAKQNFKIEDGAFHITVVNGEGADGAKWDLQFRHRNLNFKAGHTYEISCKVKAKRAGMELCSKIGNTKGDEEYCDLKDGKFVIGPAFNGEWGNAVKLTTEYQTFEGSFTPTKDLEAVEWAFHYAMGSKNNYGGNAVEGDELWFDDMSIICTTCNECDADPNERYGAISRDYSGLENNFISVNQLGYFPELKKIAVLGDNKGDVFHGATSISLSGAQTWELVDAKGGTVVATGETTAPEYDDDSHDNVCKIDFSDYKTPGTYYLRIKGKEWRSFEFRIADDIYTEKDHNLLTNAINYFYQNRSGIDIEMDYITSCKDQTALAHQGGHKVDKAYVQDAWINEYAAKTDASGTHASSQITANKGWYDAGDHGKYVVNGGISVWTLQNMYERALHSEETKEKFANGSGTVVIPETDNKIPDILDECKYELDFIQARKVDATEPTWGKYAGLYYHKLHDHKWTGLATKPWDYEGAVSEGGWDTVRIVKPPTFAATLNYAACAAQAARLWAPYDEAQAKEYLSTAIEAFEAFDKHYYEATASEETNKTSLYAPMYQAKGGGPYGDNEVRDDAYWAACEILISAKEMGDSAADTYLDKLSEYKNAFKVTTRITGGENASGEGSYTTFNWGNTASAGSLSLALHKDILTDDQVSILESSILEAADSYIKTEKEQGYGIPYMYDGPGYTDPNNLDPSIVIKGYEWGSNSMVINNLIVMAYAYDQTQDINYLSGVTQGMDYLLGTNPLSFSFITGYGSYREKNPHHRYWSNELDKTLPTAPDGILSGGPNAGLQDPYVRALAFIPGEEDNPSQRCFVDSIEAWSTNEVTINWNAPLAWITEFLQSKDVEYDWSSKSSTTGGTTTTTKGDPTDADWGNVNESKESTPEERVDVSDAVLLARFVAEDANAKVSAQGKLNADVNANGKPDSDDTIKILQFIAKLIPYEYLGTTKG